ncbi:adenosine kinase [Arenibaculum pallidiluteum]|uniref:adenosine kinase n=1 Tax=Arenibaculum pallidiluteum TaxID=2812559 RepID=UPI001A960F20|nr:adenosine kinase [Arenibaculum pallidiluteum]
MTQAALDVVGIGNAIVDVIAKADDAFLAANGIEKGAMTLIDTARAEELYGRMGPGIEMSGGSAANTMAGIASLGGKGAYIGKVRDDQLGTVFRHDISAIGVRFETPASNSGAPTARCLILVTPDAQRSMNTYLGACVELGPEDIDAALIQSAQVTYMEGYLFDPPRAKEAFRKAADLAHAAGRKVSLTLSDSFCVGRYRDEFADLVDRRIDILFGNEHEVKSLYQVDDFDAAVAAVRGRCEIAVLTRSEKGSVVVTRDAVQAIPAEPVSKLVDTTGAGDLFAAGFLHGYTTGRDLATCARIGAIAAAEVISHIGARPDASLAELVRARLG